MKPAPQDRARDPRSGLCWMCQRTKRIVKGADSPADVLICDYCDSAASASPQTMR